MKGIFTVVIFYYIKAIVAQDSCQQFPIPDHVYFDESSSTGSTIFISNETNTTQQEWIVTTVLSRKINLTFSNQTYYIKLLTAIDLDVSDPSQTCDSALETFVERISCVGTDGQPVDKIVTFHLQPVNEYPPDVNTVPDINISEGNFSLPLFLSRLFDYFKDRDCPKERLMLSISNYSSKEKDAREYFMINNLTGFLNQIKHFDYEDTHIQCGLGIGGGFLNITAEDGLHRTSKPLGVTFVDKDDSPPVFVNYQCSTTCYKCPVLPLSVDVNYSDQGPLVTEPPQIKAIDPDTNSTNITYNMEVYPEKYRDNIQFDNGTFVLLQSFANFSGYAEESDFTVTVTMQATGSNDQMSDNLTLSINVKVPPTTTTTTSTTTTTTTPSTTTQEVTSPITAPPTTTTPAPVGDANSDMSDDNKVLVIVLAVIGGVVVLILIVVVYKVRTKQPQQKYNLKDTNGLNGTAANGGALEKEMTADNPVFDGEKGGV